MEEVVVGFVVLSLCLISSAVFYVGCPNQQWVLNRHLSFYPGLSISLLISIVAWNVLRESMAGLSASFTVLSIEMMCLGILPFIIRYDSPQANKGSSKSSLTRTETYSSHKSQWLIKTIGMLLVGFPFAVFTSSLLGWSAPNSVPLSVRSQFIMWMIIPLWVTPLSLIFYVRKPFATFGVFVVLTLVAYGLLQLIKIGA